jgi:hypothetical protein
MNETAHDQVYEDLRRAEATIAKEAYTARAIPVDSGVLVLLLREYLKHHDKPTTRCSVCQGTNVTFAFWCNPNTLRIEDGLHETFQDDLDAGSCFCHDCNANTLLESIP